MSTLSIFGWIFVAIDFIAAAGLALSRDTGDAASRGLGTGLGTALAALGAVAALLLWVGRAPERALLVIVGSVLAAAPVALAVTLTVSRQGLGLIYPSMRTRKVPLEPSPQYAYPDAAGREAAIALVMNDYAKLDTLLRATPAPDLSARDERGQSLVGLATSVAVSDGGRLVELDGLRLLLAAGARPRPDDYGRDESLLELVARARSDHARAALEMLLDAGLSPDAPMNDGRSVLFHPYLNPNAARVLLARGIDRTVHDTRGGATDWSPVTYQADLKNWAAALVLLEGGVPQDHATPPGSVMARVIKIGEPNITSDDRADPNYIALMALVKR
ncbi:MAG: hypothetical protein ABMA00_00790 [Gemmatimonas sp.]